MEKVLSVLHPGKKRGKTLTTSTDITKSKVVPWKCEGMNRKNATFFRCCQAVELLRWGHERVINTLLKTDSNAGACVVKWNQNGCLQKSSTTLVGIPNDSCFTQHPRMLLPDTSSQETACVASIYKFWYEHGNSEKKSPWMIPSLILLEIWFHPSSLSLLML